MVNTGAVRGIPQDVQGDGEKQGQRDSRLTTTWSQE